MSRVSPEFWAGRRVLLTGHTGFKGSWAALWLSQMGARVSGIALRPDSTPALFDLAGVEAACDDSMILDIRDADALAQAVEKARPDIIIHMAAQALVRPSYADPLATMAANVMGTANLLEAAKTVSNIGAILIVTTDKVYENPETGQAFAETDPLGGHDPYSASKAAAEIITASWRRSFYGETPVLSARAGNVIGGGDFSVDRIVPDIWRAARADAPLQLRYPHATRPWQHVLDCLAGYFLYIEAAVGGAEVPASLNFGPDVANGEASVATLAEAMQKALGVTRGWVTDQPPELHEMGRLALDTARARGLLGWRDRLDTTAAIRQTADWYRALDAGEDMAARTRAEIAAYEEGGAVRTRDQNPEVSEG